MEDRKHGDYDALKGIVAKCDPYHDFSFAEDIEEDIVYHLMGCMEDDDQRDFFRQVIEYGCVNGITGMFMYYDGSKDFYVRHMDDMEEFLLRYEDDYGISMTIDRRRPRYVQVCWFCYEELAKSIYERMFPEE